MLISSHLDPLRTKLVIFLTADYMDGGKCHTGSIYDLKFLRYLYLGGDIRLDKSICVKEKSDRTGSFIV